MSCSVHAHKIQLLEDVQSLIYQTEFLKMCRISLIQSTIQNINLKSPLFSAEMFFCTL